MNPGRLSLTLIDPVKLNRLFTAVSKAALGDRDKEGAYKAVIAGLLQDLTGLGLLHTAAQEILKGNVRARGRLVAVLSLLMALEPATPGESRSPSSGPASPPETGRSNPDGPPSSLDLLPSTGYPPCFLLPQDIVPIYFATLSVIPEEATGPVIQYLDQQLAKIAPLDLLYDLADSVLTDEGAAIEMFGPVLEMIGLGREKFGAVQRGAISGHGGFSGLSRASTGGDSPATTLMSGEISSRLLPMPDCVGIREDCTGEVVRAVREAQAMQAESGACVIESVRPSSASIGEEITLNGSNFGIVPGEVIFPGNVQGVLGEGRWTDTEITVTVPRGTQSGSGPICLRIPLGTVVACGVSRDVYAEGCCIDFCVLRRMPVHLWPGAEAYHHTHSSTEDWADELGECNLTSVRNLSGAEIELSYAEGPQEPVPGTGVRLDSGESTSNFSGLPVTEEWVWWANVVDPGAAVAGVIDIELTCDDCA